MGTAAKETLAELIEYALAVMASMLVVAGSVVLYNSFASYESGLQLRETFSTVSGLVDRALQNGTERATLALPTSTIGCEEGTLYIRIGSEGISQSISAACNFQASVASGSYSVDFRTDSGRLELGVS